MLISELYSSLIFFMIFIIIIVFILQIIIKPIGITPALCVILVIWKVLYAPNQNLQRMFHFKQLSILYTQKLYILIPKAFSIILKLLS